MDSKLCPLVLGPVDGFDQDEGGGECDEGTEVSGRLFAAQGDALEAFELADSLFGAGAGSVERPCEPLWPVFGVLAVGNDGQGAFFPGALAVFGAVIGLVGDNGAGPDIGPRSIRVSKCGPSAAWPPVRSKAIGRPSKSVFKWILVLKPPRERPSAWPCCPPFAPAADTCARVTVESNIWTRCAVSLKSAQRGEKSPRTLPTGSDDENAAIPYSQCPETARAAPAR